MIEFFEDVKKPVPRNIDIDLRIILLKRQIRYGFNFTPKERRALQSRKNTSIFRVKRETEERIRHLHQ